MVKIVKRGEEAIKDFLANPSVKLYTQSLSGHWVEVGRDAEPRLRRILADFPGVLPLAYGVTK